jgi:8-oxo-dGTP pyrophosphatase MutT (NUDIX family)
MNHQLDIDAVLARLRRPAMDDLALREQLMPRDAEGRAARPIEPPPGVEPRNGAVMVLLYPGQDDTYLPLTVRTGSLRHHSGEVSLPGGGFDPDDGSLEQTALREASEEIGIVPEAVEVVAELAPVWIPVSNFRIVPFVGRAATRPVFFPAPDEVAAIVEVPLGTLLDPAIIHSEVRDIRGRLLRVPYFAIEYHKVWGATALVLAQLVARLRAS